jgi:hypothetical protein
MSRNPLKSRSLPAYVAVGLLLLVVSIVLDGTLRAMVLMAGCGLLIGLTVRAFGDRKPQADE